MRLFVGVDVSVEVAEGVAALIARLKTRVQSLAPRARVTWVAASRLHVTIRFLGEVPPAGVSAVETALRPPIDLPPFDLTFQGLAVFPQRGAPRAVWVPVQKGGDTLARLEEIVSLRLVEAGVAVEAQAFRPHLTIARVRDPRGLRASDLLEGFAETPVGLVHLSGVSLIESRLLPEGPEYCQRLLTLLQKPLT